MRGVGNSNLPLLISFSERLLICLFLLWTFFLFLFSLLDFLIFLFSPPPSLYIHTLFVPFTFLGKRRDFNYRYITCSPLVPVANIDMSPLPTFYFLSDSYLSLFLTRKKIFLLLSFSLISYLFLSYSFSRLLFLNSLHIATSPAMTAVSKGVRPLSSTWFNAVLW